MDGHLTRNSSYLSWGRFPRAQQIAVRLHDRHAALPDCELKMLPYGNGRSYGDSCLNDGGMLLDTRGLDRFIDFDSNRGVLRCEAGIFLKEILSFAVPRGWFLPVVPGTQLITVGGAIANDIHGKNHHRAGTFGAHVLRLELLRSDGSRLECSPEREAEWFAATVGGLGLTGLVTRAEIQMKPVRGPWIDVETIRYPDLETFFALSAESDRDYEYTVAWIDCSALGRSLGRGFFIRGNHAVTDRNNASSGPARGLLVPFEMPFSLMTPLSIRLLNGVYYHSQMRGRRRRTMHYAPFFFPLDGIACWNRIYGPRGFLQYQFVVPLEHGRDMVRETIEQCARAGISSFMTVLKVFGDRRSPGLLSYPRPGVTLALDFPNRGAELLKLLDRLDDMVAATGGAVYPAKDARMSGVHFRRFYPQCERLCKYVDPRFSSSLWRRLMG